MERNDPSRSELDGWRRDIAGWRREHELMHYRQRSVDQRLRSVEVGLEDLRTRLHLAEQAIHAEGSHRLHHEGRIGEIQVGLQRLLRAKEMVRDGNADA